jgi:hypothetical protein
MKVSSSAYGALISLSQLLVACDNGTPMFTESVAGIAAGNAPGEDAIAQENYAFDPTPVDDSTPADRAETGPSRANLTSWTFQASTIGEGELSYQPSQRLGSQTIVMDNNVVATERTFTQVDRPMLTETFSQGSELKRQSEAFKQNASAQGVLDLLLVIDNSGSMKEEQENLSGKLAPLLSYVKDSDWRIGVVTTDPSDGCLRSLINKSDAQASQAFATAVQAGIKGSGNERGILQAVNGLKGECNPTGSWLRNQSTVGVLIVSDEDNCSAGKDCGNEAYAQGSYLTQYLSSIRQTGLNARVYGLIGHPSLSAQQCQTMAAKADIYAAVIAETGGSWGSICSSDYTGTLQAISKDISAILLTQFTLQFKPSQGSLKVYIDGKLQTSGYTLHENVVEFASPPKADAMVSFQYDFSAEVPKAAFALGSKAVTGTIKVYLDGIETKGFSFDASANAIKFASAPGAKAIKVVYRRGDDLPKAFQMDPGVSLARMSVKVNGTVLGANAYSYNAENGILGFTAAPSDKALIVVNADKVLDHRLDYAIQIGGESLSAWDASTGKVIPAGFNQSTVSFSEKEYAPGRKTLIKSLSAMNWRVALDPSVLTDRLAVIAEGRACESFTVAEGYLDLSPCGYALGSLVKIALQYEKDRRDTFDLAVLEPTTLENAKWKVKVNGTEITNFTLVNGQIHIGSLPAKAVIEVTMEEGSKPVL